MPSILDILKDHRVPHREHGSHHHAGFGWVQIDCPWCGRDSAGFHLGVNIDRGYANCWRCGSKRMGDVLVELLHMPLREALNLLDTVEKAPSSLPEPRPISGRLGMPSGLGPLLEPHTRYLRQRGFDPEELTRLWGLEAIGVGGRLSWRIWIPIHWRGEVVSWTTRSIGDQGRKYIAADPNERKSDPREILYGYDYVRHAIIVCEGPFDAWRIGPGAVALMGLGWSEAQFSLIAAVPSRVICFDNEPAAQLRAKRLASDLERRSGTTTLVELEASDPAEAEKEEVQKLRQSFLK